MYRPLRLPEIHDVQIRGLNCRFYSWGTPTALPVYLLHGFADCALSFQFIVDSLPEHYYLVAPDWRGFGDSGWASGEYWFPEYLGDLDALIAQVSPDRQVALVGHSMGGNIAGLYAGSRPEQVSHLVSLEGFGLASVPATAAPARYRQWLAQLRQPPQPRVFVSLDALADRIRALAPQLPDGSARYLAGQWSIALADGRRQLKMDPKHRRVNAVLYRREEAHACWREVQARTLAICGTASTIAAEIPLDALADELAGCFRHFRMHRLAGAGHQLHLEHPQQVAALVDDFLSD